MDIFWEQNASEWSNIIDSNAISSRSITNASIIERLNQLKAKSILDIGCGEGWLGRALEPEVKYLGLDGSEKLIVLAKTKSPTGNYFCIDYERLSIGEWSSKEKFGLILFNFSILHEEIQSLLSETQKYLTSDGRVLIQTLHPCFTSDEYSNGWIEDDFSLVSQSIKGKMPWYKRTLSDWSNIFLRSGLLIEKIDEPKHMNKPVSIIFTLRRE